MLALALPSAASAIELRDANLLAGGNAVLENVGGTIRLEDARLGRVGPTVFVPEPGALGQLASGAALLTLLRAHRRIRVRAVV